MKRKKDDDPPPPKAKRNKGKDISFCSITGFAIDKNIRTTLKAVKEDVAASGPSDAVINEKTSMPTVKKDTSVQTVLPAPVPIKTSKKYRQN
ncbi:hypothetical protein G6F70_001762 [Rhizopus microsporus]|nr:hypothetical protein G6F71_002376 [Rhizopus microsporus]KAG1203019.1 hypothetical protein G6F70_001762 [Rhizopus microsporus]KAG1216229.1 hypothetical protein G6F69_000283 [Rhizopus microsporus]KAG1235785.1 hypothetical protein G6F67_002501 [Rhizopus microsporus]KAG1269448.1 hypothetical protein G6F68_000267 [Rhizopus microsporus]